MICGEFSGDYCDLSTMSQRPAYRTSGHTLHHIGIIHTKQKNKKYKYIQIFLIAFGPFGREDPILEI